MHGYGLPRTLELEFPDRADICLYGLKGFKVHSKRKQASRRIWKKRYRLKVKNMIKKEVTKEEVEN